MARSLSARAWSGTSAAGRLLVARRIAAALGPGFTALDRTLGESGLAAVRHEATGLDFVVVPGGTFRMGIDPSQLRDIAQVSRTHDERGDGLERIHTDEASTAKPPRRVRVAPFLMARAPLSEQQSGTGANPDPAWLTAREAARAVAAGGFRLPSEAEWEYVAREGGAVRWLGARPGERGDPITAVERACRAVAGRPYRATAKEPAINAFGLWGLLLGEWIADGWHSSYRGAPATSRAWAPGKLPVIRRGGAGGVWPWQGAGEHIEAHAGIRILATARDRATVRLVIDFPAGLDWETAPVPPKKRAAPAKKRVPAKKRAAAATKRSTPKKTSPSSRDSAELTRLTARATELALARMVPPRATLTGKRIETRRGVGGRYEAVAFVVYMPARGKYTRAQTLYGRGVTREDALRRLIALIEQLE